MGRDYILLTKKVEQVSGAKHLVEYHLTVEAAKHIAMMENNDKGFQVRDYYIELEHRFDLLGWGEY
ncbi:MAG: antA/AntB antirepressor family protein [SAR324 cluster bacterium]|nr:antA/AntB antirepressor family protein [SAR324 cluster bacterium]